MRADNKSYEEILNPSEEEKAVYKWLRKHCLEAGGPGRCYRDSFTISEIEEAVFAGIEIGRQFKEGV